MDPLRIYVVFDPAFIEGPEWTRWLSRMLSGLGMQREEARFGVPVLHRSEPWGEPQEGLLDAQQPRRIRLADASSNCVLLLIDSTMADFHEAKWRDYVQDLQAQMTARGGADLLIPVLLADSVPTFAANTQAIRGFDADLPNQPRAATRFLVRLMNALLVHRQTPEQKATHQPGHGIFVSHAKRDGWETAKRIVNAMSKPGDGTRPAFFLDADSLIPGTDYEKRFEEAIGTGSLLALVTDVYHARPWCRWEMLTAKRLGRPIVVADLCAGRVERTLPYLGNVPTERIACSELEDLPEADIERLALALLSESLRCDLWRQHAEQRLEGRNCRLLTRPPELADLALGMSEQATNRPWIVYPDPPLGNEEVDLLSSAFPRQCFFSISQALSRS